MNELYTEINLYNIKVFIKIFLSDINSAAFINLSIKYIKTA